MAGIYSNNVELNETIEKIVASIESGKPANDLVAMIKNAPTMILLASPEHEKARYRPGNQLVTYTGVDKEGNPIKETWGGGVANINESSVILKNAEPIRYSKESCMNGSEVKGTFNPDGTFVREVRDGEEILFNEYVSDVNFVKEAYGIEPTTNWQKGFKLQPSYVFQISSKYNDVKIITKSGAEINLAGGDYVVIDTKKDKVLSVHGCKKDWLDNTYINLEEHLKTLQG